MSNYLNGKLLVAMPYMSDPRFTQGVIYICGHDDNGAMGLVINKILPAFTFCDLLQQLELDFEGACEQEIFYGGPIEISRGFVLHSTDYTHDSTVIIDKDFALTASIEILRAIAANRGPKQAIMAMGYAGWSPGQLDHELQENDWISVDASLELVFNVSLDSKWHKALASIGVNPNELSIQSGHA